MKRLATVTALTLLSLAGCIVPPSSGPAYGGGGGGYASDPSTSESAGSSGEPAAPTGPVSVEIRSACPDTVKVFYGSDPKFGSGTHSSIDSNSVQSESFQPGDMFWLTDESDNGLASVTVSANTHQIEVDASCTSLHEN